MSTVTRLVAAALLVSVGLSAQTAPGSAVSRAPRPSSPPRVQISYADVQPIWALLRPHLPPELAATATGSLDAVWPGWVTRRDAEIRGRVVRGDEDSLVNLWLFGTAFTVQPPLRPAEIDASAGAAPAAMLEARLEDLLSAIASPGANPRLRFARQLLADRGIDPARTAGRAAARQWLTGLRQQVLLEAADHARTIDAARTTPGSTAAMLNTYATLYRDRGLSSDTSLLSSFGVDAALDALKSSGLLGDRAVRRVALVGPGLDVINKADGYDFFPEQTIQPFALVDSLIRLGLSAPADLEVTTFDVSARVNQHVGAAVERARAGRDYAMQLPLRDTEPWSLALLRYWENVGTRIGTAVAPERVPPAAGRVKMRAVRIRADVVAKIEARDLNIVLERLALPADRLFDLVVATNVLAYYGTFEQALAVANIGRMLRPGGSFLSNQAVLPVPPMKPEVGEHQVVYSQLQLDHFFYYQKQVSSQVPSRPPTP